MMRVNKIGMIKIPNNVAVVIPATTVIPIDVRAPEPAPVEIAMVITPRIKGQRMSSRLDANEFL